VCPRCPTGHRGTVGWTGAGDIRVSVAIQHHPARAHLIPALSAALGGAEVVTDTDPDHGSPLRTYLAALARTPPWATHRLVVQDDAEPVDLFPMRAHPLICERPDVLIAFFTPGVAPHRTKVRRAQIARDRWAVLTGNWLPTVATCWPVRYAADFVEWANDKYGDRVGEQRGDDGPLGEWASRSRATMCATVPSLIQHPDVEPSLVGRKASAGANRARVAALYEN
jgi:hypothetical protein